MKTSDLKGKKITKYYHFLNKSWVVLEQKGKCITCLAYSDASVFLILLQSILAMITILKGSSYLFLLIIGFFRKLLRIF